MTETRIVSLIASATEIVAALGLSERLVGRSHECDYPPAVAGLPVCSEAKIDVAGSSRQIDDRVKSLAGEAVSVYRLRVDVLRDAPTHIITQTQCDVCAVSLRDVEEAMSDLIGLSTRIVVLAPMCLADVWSDIRYTAAALRVGETAESLIVSLKSTLDELATSVRQARTRPRIACIEWIDPLMVAGNWVPELVTIAGGEDLLGKAGEHSPWLDWPVFNASDPDVIAVMACGFDIVRTRHEMAVLDDDPRWQQLRAVREGRIFLTDGNQFFNRPGPRLVESARILAEILHPEIFSPTMQGRGWIPWRSDQEAGCSPAPAIR